MMTKYRNPFYGIVGALPFIVTTSEPADYKGYKIYERKEGMFDIVKDGNGICLALESLDRAKRYIDYYFTNL